jgi:hypothetical protein
MAACAAPATTPNDGAPTTGPQFCNGGPDAEDYGASLGYPKGDRATFFRVPSLVGSHSHLDELFEGRVIRKAGTPSHLGRAVFEPAISWEFQGEALTLDAYLTRNPTTGLLIARGDTILVERYQYDRHDRHRFTSWSMAKTDLDADRYRHRGGPDPFRRRRGCRVRARARRHGVWPDVPSPSVTDVIRCAIHRGVFGG